jgi:hypothetical protein
MRGTPLEHVIRGKHPVRVWPVLAVLFALYLAALIVFH